MSWQTYVDDHLMCEIEGHHLTSAAIMGQDGSVWAQSASFPQFKPEEITNIINDFNEPGTLAPIGLFLGSTKYMVIQGEPGAVIRGKKTLLGFCEVRKSVWTLHPIFPGTAIPEKLAKIAYGGIFIVVMLLLYFCLLTKAWPSSLV
ncbi:hypothetical protein C4D60_Mb01t15090 [Musa balbisiana]|uniref:Profilin n=1 Tax=Musa balbisiana TaxID=52838 RepID=A0A4S8JMB7_MUSBA|nr:hypothetical protein C4D60_Mb01t15090 [Musa balbisiana]